MSEQWPHQHYRAGVLYSLNTVYNLDHPRGTTERHLGKHCVYNGTLKFLWRRPEHRAKELQRVSVWMIQEKVHNRAYLLSKTDSILNQEWRTLTKPSPKVIGIFLLPCLGFQSSFHKRRQLVCHWPRYLFLSYYKFPVMKILGMCLWLQCILSFLYSRTKTAHISCKAFMSELKVI